MELIKPDKFVMSQQEKDDIMMALNKFDKWLVNKKIALSPTTITQVDLPFANGDWTMRVEGNQVSFNTYVREKCSAEYYKSIVLHEFFHLAVQKVPDKDDAVKIKDDFGGALMNLIDIEADFFTAAFYKEELGYDLISYLRLYFEGGKVFANKWIRVSKLERFIGTFLSISKMFLDHPKKTDKIECCDLYLTCVAPLSTNAEMHVLVIRKEHIYLDYIQATTKDFIDIKNCYASIDNMKFKKYAEKVITFCCHSLNREIPKYITTQLQKIKD